MRKGGREKQKVVVTYLLLYRYNISELATWNDQGCIINHYLLN